MDEGLTLETPAFKLFTVGNLRNQLILYNLIKPFFYIRSGWMCSGNTIKITQE